MGYLGYRAPKFRGWVQGLRPLVLCLFSVEGLGLAVLGSTEYCLEFNYGSF